MTAAEPAARRTESAGEVGEEYHLLRSALDAALEPWALLKAVRDSDGRVVDFTYHDINSIAARQQRLRREDLLGRSVAESLPELVRSGVMDLYIRCIDTGEPLVLDDLAYYGRTLDGPERQSHRYQLRGVRVETDYLGLNWRDTNRQYLAERSLAESEERYRLLAENSSDVVVHVRDRAVSWASPSVEDSFGAPPQYWIGQSVDNLVVADDLPAFAGMVAQTAAGATVVRRLRLLDAHGVVRWAEVHAKVFLDADSNPDGYTASLRVVDDEVAAEQALENARRRQAEIDALYREVMGSAAVGMCIASPEGAFDEVNDALCEFYGYDAKTLSTMTWQEVTAPDYLMNDIANVEEILAGRSDSYRTTKQFIHADGHLIWGDLTVSCLRGPSGEVQKFIGQIVDVTADVEAREQLEAARRLLRATADSMLDPQMLLEAVRDPATGRVVDFIYREANAAACKDMATTRDELIGRRVLELLPGFAESGLLSYYAQCLETGQPGALDDHPFDHDVQEASLRYDIRIAPAGKDLISITFRDVTDRFQTARRIAASETMLRASAESMLDPQALMEAVRDPDGQVVDFRYIRVNQATCSYLGLSESDLVGHTQLERSPNLKESELHHRYTQCLQDGEPVILDDYSFFNEILDDGRRYDIRATRAGPDLLSLTWRDVTDRYLTAQRIAESEEKYRLLAENSGDVIVHIRDGRIAWISPSVEGALGAPPEYWVGRQLQETVPPEDRADQAVRTATVLAGGVVRQRIRVMAADGVVHWFDTYAQPFYDAHGHEDGALSTLRLVDDEVAAEQDAEEARRQQARADALYRRSMDSSAVGMCLVDVEGGFVDVNDALCQYFGYDAETLRSKTWQELTAEAYLQADLDNLANVLAGRIESYRMTKQYIRADGHPIWGDLSVSCVRDASGQVEVFVSQIVDITAEVEARERLVASEERNRVLADDLQSELSSAAHYLQSVMPDDLAGRVSVTARYLPSQILGGDCYDFRWIDDDRLVFYLLDVSGHGVESALIAVSAHNMLRSASFSETTAEPQDVLARLNQQFSMGDHDDNYLTMFYGVYQASSATLRYANAGHPPALLISGGQLTRLPSQSLPIGMFDDTTFTATTLPIPPGSQILLYSDGAYEIPLEGGGRWHLQDFENSFSRLAGSPDWSLDDVIDTALGHSATGSFADDCCLIRLNFGVRPVAGSDRRTI